MFIPVDKFESLLYTDIPKSLYYVLKIGDNCYPNFNEDGYWPSYSVGMFKSRYNKEVKNIATLKGKIDEFQNNQDIIDCLNTLSLDVEKFWYALLFTYDICREACINNSSRQGSLSNIKSLIQFIEEEVKVKGIINFISDSEIELTIKAGKRKLIINDLKSLHYIAQFCKSELDREVPVPLTWQTIDESDLSPRSISDFAYLFCTTLINFFNKQDSILEYRKGSVSNKEKELLSYLVYFVDISQNPKLLEPLLNGYNTIKGFINPKNKPQISFINKTYKDYILNMPLW